jgi:8-oxo-dGTP diphosphatase
MAVLIEGLSIKKKRSAVTVNAYLILKEKNTFLFSLRKNTGYFDGSYGLVSGHVEDGEPASVAIIREAKEEANITIHPESIKVVHIMHRKTDRFNIDIFFECTSWEGELLNLEPDKCEELNFFNIESLPDNLIPYIGHAIFAAINGEIYSEIGW